MDQTIFAHMIGVPFLEKGRTMSGWDCWGAVRFGLLNGFGVEVPSYTEDYTTSHDSESVSALIVRESIQWPEVTIAEAKPGDVVILRVAGQPWHCGLVIDPPYFVHASSTISKRTGLPLGTVRNRWDSLLWEKRVLGVHRHPQMMELACK